MQPRTLSQILSELDTTYNPQIDAVRQRQALIPGQIQAEEQGLEAKQGQAFDDILGGARRRGLGFSGIPLGEQAKYTATEYLPALARLRQTGREQAMSLEDAILGIQERRNTMGQQIFQTEQDRFEQRRQFDAQQAAQQRAAAAAAAQPNPLAGIFGGGGGQAVQGAQTQQAAPQAQQQRDYNFVKNLIGQVNGGNGATVSLILSQAKKGDARSKEVMRAFYQLQNKPIPPNFRSFL